MYYVILWLLCLQNWDRLYIAIRDMQVYWNMLEWKRKQQEMGDKEQMGAKTTLSQRIRCIQLDLRDLMTQVSSQVSTLKDFFLKYTEVTAFYHHKKSVNEATVKFDG